MEKTEIQKLLDGQRKFFLTGKTLPIAYRREALKKLLKAVDENETLLAEALYSDLGKSRQESYMCEIGLVESEIGYMLRHMHSFAKEHRVHTPLAQTLSRSFVKPSPYGNVLIMSPWNYPVLLTLEPLTDALAAGNTAIVKPSAYSPAVSDVLEKLISDCFSKEYVAVVKGGRQENASLLDCDFNYIFFTGSKMVGKEVMRKASERLIPITLELGGKSPCIVDKSANIKLAAKRIVFGKFVNCGQTCVAPDYIYCDPSVKGCLIEELTHQIHKQYGESPLDNKNYGKIISKKHYDRITGLIDPQKTVLGGKSDPQTLKIEPTIMDNVSWEDAVMQEEIFGPVLPILEYKSLEDAADKINSMDSPLALYIFSSDKKNIDFVKNRIQFGGGCVNDTLIHLATSEMGFGGVGESGMGSYHGRAGFDAFSHKKSIVDKKTIIDLPMRYQPYTKIYEKMIRVFLR